MLMRWNCNARDGAQLGKQPHRFLKTDKLFDFDESNFLDSAELLNFLCEERIILNELFHAFLGRIFSGEKSI